MPNNKTSTPWKWPAKWVKEEKFWQDVTTRTLSILISGFLLYLIAILSGVVQAPAGRAIIGLLLIGLVLPGVALGLPISLMNYRYKKAVEKHGAGASHRHAIMSWKAGVPLALVWAVLFLLVIRLIRWWAFTPAG